MMLLYLAYSCLLLHFFYKHSQAGISVGITRIVHTDRLAASNLSSPWRPASTLQPRLRIYPDSILCPYLGIRRGNIAGLAKFTRDFPDCRKNSVADGQLATPALMVSSHYHMMQLSLCHAGCQSQMIGITHFLFVASWKWVMINTLKSPYS